jgi:uncharacterized protein YjbI with pentapeptide repeats
MTDIPAKNSSSPGVTVLPKQRYRTCLEACCSVLSIEWFNVIFHGSIPLVMAVSAIAIVMQQHAIIQENRTKDLFMAAEQRHQDLEIARLQRDEDLNISYLQNEEDFKIFQLQREEDRNTLELQRAVDLEIVASETIARKNREMKQRIFINEQHQEDIRRADANKMEELVIDNNLRQENILSDYQGELLSILLRYGLENMYTNPALIFEIQMKTRTALKQLDPRYRTFLMLSLFDADIFDIEYLKPDHAILAYANLSTVDFGYGRELDVQQIDMVGFIRTYNKIRMRGANLRNASFRNALMSDRNPDLFAANLDYFDWTYSFILSTCFEHLSMNAAVFTNASLIGVAFKKVHLNQVSFRHVAQCDQCHFESLSMINADLSQAKFAGAFFFKLSIMESNLSHSSFMKSTFEEVDMTLVDLTKTNVGQGSFKQVKMMMCEFLDTKFSDCMFHVVNMTGCNGFNESNWTKMTLKSTTLPNGTFIADKCLNC